MTENLTSEPDTVVALDDGTPAYTDSFGVVRDRNGEPIESGEILWVKSRDAPDRDIQFQVLSDTGMLVGLHDTLDDAWEACEDINRDWDDGKEYLVAICYADKEPSLKEFSGDKQ